MPLTVIRACAGSGKTYTLATSFLRILLQRGKEGHAQDPAAILATTFTRAAAGEILDRIIQLLAAATLSDSKRAELAAHIECPVAREDCQRVLRTLAGSLDRLGISTMDAFFQQTAKAFAPAMGLAPGWQPAVDESADELDRAALRALLLRAEPESLANALWTYKRKTVSSIHNALIELSPTLDALAIPAHDPAQYPRPQERVWMESEVAPALSFLAASATWMPKTAAGQPRAHWEKAVRKLSEEMQSGTPVIGVLENTLAIRALEGSPFDRVPIPEALLAALTPALQIAKSALREQHDARLHALAWLAHHYRHARDSAVFLSAAYTFDDVSRILAANTVRNDDLYFRLGTKFEHVLFDEFQDTNRRQFEFFRPLVEEIGASGGCALVVGDEKQAIYGWRGGDRELMRGPLLGIGERIGTAPGPELHHSYRSSPAVLNAVNRTFDVLRSDWLPGDGDPAALRAAGRDWMEHFKDHESATIVQKLQGTVHLHEISAGELDEDADAPVIEHALQLLGGHLSEDRDRKTAILLRKNKLMPRIVAEIRRRFPDADVSGEGGNPLTDSRAVEIVLSLFTWLDHPGHTAARLVVLTSPVREVFGLPSAIPARGQPAPGEARHLRNLRRELMNHGFAALIRTWIRAEPFRTQCSAHDLLRCEQLIEVARDFDRRGPVRPSAFVSHVRTRRVERPGGSSVRVMSIHASKGLEFEAVILLDLDARTGHGGDAEVMEVGGEWHVMPSKESAALLDLEHVREAKLRRDFSEELSVLYVAMTRARSFLDVVLREKSNTPIATLLRTALSSLPMRHEGLSASACDAASGRGRNDPCQPDPGIADRGIQPATPAAGVQKDLRPIHVTPSSQEDGGTILVSQILAPANRTAMRRGELIHAWLAKITWIEDGLPAPAALLSGTEELWAHLSKSDATALADGLLSLIQNPAADIHRAFNRALFAGKSDVELWRERRFAVVTDETGGAELLTGTFDRVVLWRNSAGDFARAEILDFKTDTFRDEVERRKIGERYGPQLTAYRRALRTMLPALPADAVGASLCFAG